MAIYSDPAQTLAVGVNLRKCMSIGGSVINSRSALAAHTVVIKGVKIYHNNLFQEYSDLDVMQMIGRAVCKIGRPLYGSDFITRAGRSLVLHPVFVAEAVAVLTDKADKEGVAIIMCEQHLESKYRALAHGKTLLESCLHLNLCEHINAEIGLGTINNMHSARVWLKSSFLFQRIKCNPSYYQIGKDADKSWERKLDEMVAKTVQELEANKLIQHSDCSNGERGVLRSTEYGDIMSKVLPSPRRFCDWKMTGVLLQLYIRLKTVRESKQEFLALH
jgi:ATP-dependent DNA helicase HFM1/MER3